MTLYLCFRPNTIIPVELWDLWSCLIFGQDKNIDLDFEIPNYFLSPPIHTVVNVHSSPKACNSQISNQIWHILCTCRHCHQCSTTAKCDRCGSVLWRRKVIQLQLLPLLLFNVQSYILNISLILTLFLFLLSWSKNLSLFILRSFMYLCWWTTAIYLLDGVVHMCHCDTLFFFIFFFVFLGVKSSVTCLYEIDLIWLYGISEK